MSGGIASLNTQLSVLNGLLKAIPAHAAEAKTAIDAYGGDTPSGGTSELHLATGGGGIANKPSGGIGLTGIRAGAAVVAAGVAVLSKHVDDSIAKVNDATKDVLQQLIDAVALRDKAQAEALTYLRTRATEFYNGNAQMTKVLNLMARWKDAQKAGNAGEMSAALEQLIKEIKIMNDNLIGRGNTKGAFIDLDRLLGAGAADAASKISSAQSTGKAP